MNWRPENWQKLKRDVCAHRASENQASYWNDGELAAFEGAAELMVDAICAEVLTMKNPYPKTPKFIAAHNGFEVFRADILAKLRGKK